MNVPLVILIFFGLSIFFIFLFKRELLVHKKFTTYFIIYCLILCILGLFLYYDSVKGGDILILPIFQFIIYRIFYKIFVSIYKREPKDTFWSMDLSLMKDGIFNFLYVISSLCISLFLEHYFLK